MPTVYSQPLEILYPPFQKLETRDYPAKTEAQITDPQNANPLVEGEFVNILGGADTGTIQRAAKTDPHPMLYLGQIGRTDIQTTKKAPVALEPPLIIRTKLVDGTGLVIGDKLMVDDITFNGLTRSGLKEAAGSGSFVVGQVLKAGTNTGDPDGSFWEIFMYRHFVALP